jgi:hypothetical protein
MARSFAHRVKGAGRRQTGAPPNAAMLLLNDRNVMFVTVLAPPAP